MRVLVVFCHPTHDSLIGAALDRATVALERSGHDLRVTDLYADGFRPEMSADERRSHKQPGLTADLRPYADDLGWAQVLVLIYPTWWSGQPAMLKGWIDRIWIAGVAWELPAGAKQVRGRLRNIRRIVTVTTHGSSKLINALEGENGKRAMTRTMRSMCSWRTRTTWCALYGVDTSDDQTRANFLARVERTMTKL
jgi:putative NADPH-quinone reductase